MQERFEEFETWPSEDEEVAFAQALVEEFELEFLPVRNGLLRVRMSVDGVWAD